jgi:predicted double-glycine peptidase
MSQLLLISSLWAGIIIGLFAYAVPAQAKVHLNLPSAVGSLPIKTWKQLRDADLEKQDLDYSCGSAATATILRSFYGRDIYEKDILDEVVLVGDDGTASFSDLQQAVKKFGFKAIGISANFEKLKTIKIPAIVYLRYRDKDHFSVIRGINDQGVVWLGDPSWGNRKFTEHQFRDMWETRDNEQLKGKLLLIIPTDKTLATLNQDFFHPPEVNATAIELLTLTSY